MVINWLDCVWYELTLKGISEQTLSRGHLLVELSLARLFNSHWHNASTVTGMIVQQSLARLFDRRWHDCSTITGMIVHQSLARVFNSRWHNSTVVGTIFQQSLARFFNSYWHDSSTMAVTVKIFSFFLCWHNSWTVMFTVEESCHVPGIRHMIQWNFNY